jgi:sRNA-binding protein
VKEQIRERKEKLKEQRRMEEEKKKQEEKEKLLQMRPTKHKEKAGGGEPQSEKTKERRETVKKVKIFHLISIWTQYCQSNTVIYLRSSKYGFNNKQLIF